jgi:hypothetical protein
MELTIKGHTFTAVVVKDSFSRRAVSYANSIMTTLKKLGVTPDQVDVELPNICSKKAPAAAIWFMDGHRMHYKYSAAATYAENLAVVWKVLECEVNDVVSGKKELRDFIGEFTEEEDIEKQRKEAREILGVAADSLSLEEIDQKFKELAKKHHPDTPNGNIEEFKKINAAHKILRRELH